MQTDQLTFSMLRALAGRDWLQRPLNVALAPFNPFDPRRHADPYPLYDRARRQPIFYNRMARTWMVTGYEEATAVLRGPVSVDRRHTIESITPYRNMRSDNIELLLSSMLMRDAPDHGRLRKLVNRAFTPRAVTNVAPRISELTDELIGELADRATDRPVDGAPIDVMAGLANRLPIYAIGELLGIPRADREALKAMSDVVAQFVDPFTVFDATEMDRTIDDLRSMFDRLAQERTVDPQDDLLTALVQAEDDGRRLSRDELIAMVILLLIAGHETTSGLLGNAIIALGRNPGAVRQLRQEPALIRNAVEEFLRFDSPIQATDRTVVEDFTVGNRTVPAGAIVLVLFGAANRDPRRYDCPNELRLDRHDPRPISFGHGIHHCVGAALARLEAAAVIPAFVDAFPNFRVDERALTWRRSTTFRGPKVLPVHLLGRDRAGAGAGPDRT
ncbi:MAG: cytochrome P450, partial [Acidimicrobiales bacterium]